MAELLPCPFCGGPANILNWQAFCTQCGAATKPLDTPEECEAAWNKRVREFPIEQIIRERVK